MTRVVKAEPTIEEVLWPFRAKPPLHPSNGADDSSVSF
jgi:hypothetical protein